jgi:hypothetical protein
MSGIINVPTGASIALDYTPVLSGDAAVIVLPPGARSVDEVLGESGVSAMLTHDRGTNWPDKAGCELASEALRRGGAALFHFQTIDDARPCYARLLKIAQAGGR